MRLVAIRDLADRQRADREHILYEASREALRLRDEFIALAAHELRTPLTSLKLRSSFAKQQLDGKADAQVEAGWVLELVGKVSYQVDRLIRLVEELLDASRVKSGLSLDVGPIDLAALARETLDEMADVLRAAKCELKLQADLGVEVMADRLWIERVITSLVNNAIKFGEGGLVEVVIAQQGGDALLSVRDHGVGIAEHDQQRIFEKFERVVSDRNVTGLGLGLYLSKEIVEAHHGQIEVKSELGKGALFQVRLPTRGASVSRRSE
jgi:signal transduction histidine kinase